MCGTYCIMPYSPYDDRINNPLETENPYSFQEYIDNDGWLFGTINWLFGEITGRNKENEANRMTRANQEDAQAHDMEMAQYQQAMHEQNLVNDPQLIMQGYRNAGISANAAAQAVLGSQSTFAPSGSSVGSQGAAMSPSLLPSLLQTLVDLPLKQAQTENLGALTKGQEIDNAYKPAVTQATIDKVYTELSLHAKEVGLSKDMLDIQNKLAESTIALNSADIDLKVKELDKFVVDINKTIAETDLLQQYSVHELIKMSLTRAEIGKTLQDTATSAAQEGLYRQETLTSSAQEGLINAQTSGQIVQNENLEIEHTLKDWRLQCSKILGFDVDSDETSMALQSMITNGNANELVYTLNVTKDNIARYGTGLKVATSKSNGNRHSKSGKYRYDPINDPSNDYMPVWNP